MKYLAFLLFFAVAILAANGASMRRESILEEDPSEQIPEEEVILESDELVEDGDEVLANWINKEKFREGLKRSELVDRITKKVMEKLRNLGKLGKLRKPVVASSVVGDEDVLVADAVSDELEEEAEAASFLNRFKKPSGPLGYWIRKG
jgi:hypothetical protein